LYYFTESQVASYKHFQCQNRRFRVFEAVLLDGISKSVSNINGASYNFEFDFFIQVSNKKMSKKLSALVQKVYFDYKKPSKKLFIS
jgi:hypothetical protein